MLKNLREAYGAHITKLGRDNQNIILLEGDLADSTQSEPFQIEHPKRHFQVGIAEQNMVGMAAGLALEGKLPVVNSFAAFIAMRACEQVRTDVAYPNLNVKFVASHAGLSAGTAGPTHHTIEDIGILRSIPNLRIFVPGDAVEVTQAVDVALSIEGPVYLRISAVDSKVIYDDSHKFQEGKGTIIREGDEISIFTTGTMISQGCQICDRLEEEHGIRAKLIQMASIKPLDIEMVKESIDCAHRIFTIEEHNYIGGLGSAIAEVIAEHGKGKLTRFGIRDRYAPITGNQPFLFEQEGIDAEAIYARIANLVRA